MTNWMEQESDLFIVFYNRWWSRLMCMANHNVGVVVCSPDVVIHWESDMGPMTGDAWPFYAAAALEP